MTKVYLAHLPGTPGDNSLSGVRGVARIPADSAPSLLISYVYIDAFFKVRGGYQYRDWCLDSGAFSAFKSGQVVDLAEYTAFCKHHLAADPKLVEVFALDVIGDWRGSRKNTDAMWADGVPAIPVYHYGAC